MSANSHDHMLPLTSASGNHKASTAAVNSGEPPKKRRGRPRKSEEGTAAAEAKVAATTRGRKMKPVEMLNSKSAFSTVAVTHEDSALAREIAAKHQRTLKSVIHEGIEWVSFFHDLHDELLSLCKFYNAPSATQLLAAMMENYRHHMTVCMEDPDFSKKEELQHDPVLFDTELPIARDFATQSSLPRLSPSSAAQENGQRHE